MSDQDDGRFVRMGVRPQPDMQLVDKDGNVILTICAGAHPVNVNRLGADMVFEWKPAPGSDAQ